MTSAEGHDTATVRSGWFTRKRYGNPVTVIGSVVTFGILFGFAAYTIIQSAYLMSNHCFDHTGQIVCPTSGPDWARPLPATAALSGLLAGFAGLLTGRPVRTPALAGGFLLIAAGLAGSRLMSPT